MDALIQAVDEQLRALISQHGLREEHALARWGTTVTLHGPRWTLELFYGEREFDLLIGISFAAFPRKNAVPLWAVLEALGLGRCGLAPATWVDDAELQRQLAALAEILTHHREVLDREPTRELFQEVSRILDRYARSIRKQEAAAAGSTRRAKSRPGRDRNGAGTPGTNG